MLPFAKVTGMTVKVAEVPTLALFVAVPLVITTLTQTGPCANAVVMNVSFGQPDGTSSPWLAVKT
jgi:hypothetical protein